MARYDYDNLGRLTVLRDGPSNTPIETYGYDATGNRTSLLHSGVTTSFTYPSTSHRLSSAGGVARTYDGVGNTLTIGGTTKQFNYGADDRISSVQQGGALVRGYNYNALGERVLSTIPGITGNPDGSGGTPDVHTYTVYDESGRWLGDYGTNGAVLQQAIWLDDLPVGLLAGAGANQKLHYIEPDHLGTPRAVIDRTRNLAIWTWALQGEAFGNSPPNQDPDLDGTNFVFDMRFPGQRYDPATGLNYNYFRDYEPTSGRFITSDPTGLFGGASTYGYAGVNPLQMVDPQGLSFFDPAFDLVYRATDGWTPSDGAINFWTGLGDGVSSALTLGTYSTADFRESQGIGGKTDECSLVYKGMNLAGGLMIPTGRFAYISRVSKLANKIPTNVAEAIALSAERNAIKRYFRGYFAPLFTDYRSAAWAEARFLARGGEFFAQRTGSSNQVVNYAAAFGFGAKLGSSAGDACDCE
ncbi:RHS repeat-associated core domain-containing protein [Lysobacter silvisoli]|uniref:RHS repeat-associated core domain-containing protein n=1 Tax=Lysobacter silvisoli TaxID=2293254 RepID=UPI0022AB5223|nr:RHS repeat-associated core domain-containing protein [Lysobacter silvisoli]